jgi:hypothetical protein
VPEAKVLVSTGGMQASRCQHTSAYVSIRQHTSAYVSIRSESIRWHTRDAGQPLSGYVRIRQDTSGYVRIRQDTPAYAVEVCLSNTRDACRAALSFVQEEMEEKGEEQDEGRAAAVICMSWSATKVLA